MKPQHFGNWLRQQIANLPMSQAAFARHAGIHRATLIDWLSQAAPSIREDNVTRLAIALDRPREQIEDALGRPSASAA